MDIGRNASRLRFRLVGTEIEKANLRNHTGLYLDDVYPHEGILDYVRGLYRDLQTSRRPLWSANNVRHTRTGQKLLIRRLMLPLASNGADVDMSFGVQTFEDASRSATDGGVSWLNAAVVGERARVSL